MAKINGIFKPLDEQLFKQIDTLKKAPTYQKLSEQIASLGESQQKNLNQISTFAIILLPFLGALALLLINNSIKDRLDLKRNILTQVSTYQTKKAETETIGRSVLSPHSVSNKSDLEKRISKVVSRRSIGKGKITVSNFKSTLASGGIEQTNAKLQFKKLTSTQFTDFLLSILQSEKMKVEELIVDKDTKSKLLKGHLLIIHYGKGQ
jgi:hypothetical protein